MSNFNFSENKGVSIAKYYADSDEEEDMSNVEEVKEEVEKVLKFVKPEVPKKVSVDEVGLSLSQNYDIQPKMPVYDAGKSTRVFLSVSISRNTMGKINKTAVQEFERLYAEKAVTYSPQSILAYHRTNGTAEAVYATMKSAPTLKDWSAYVKSDKCALAIDLLKPSLNVPVMARGFPLKELVTRVVDGNIVKGFEMINDKGEVIFKRGVTNFDKLGEVFDGMYVNLNSDAGLMYRKTPNEMVTRGDVIKKDKFTKTLCKEKLADEKTFMEFVHSNPVFTAVVLKHKNCMAKVSNWLTKHRYYFVYPHWHQMLSGLVAMHSFKRVKNVQETSLSRLMTGVSIHGGKAELLAKQLHRLPPGFTVVHAGDDMVWAMTKPSLIDIGGKYHQIFKNIQGEEFVYLSKEDDSAPVNVVVDPAKAQQYEFKQRTVREEMDADPTPMYAHWLDRVSTASGSGGLQQKDNVSKFLCTGDVWKDDCEPVMEVATREPDVMGCDQRQCLVVFKDHIRKGVKMMHHPELDYGPQYGLVRGYVSQTWQIKKAFVGGTNVALMQNHGGTGHGLTSVCTNLIVGGVASVTEDVVNQAIFVEHKNDFSVDIAALTGCVGKQIPIKWMKQGLKREMKETMVSGEDVFGIFNMNLKEPDKEWHYSNTFEPTFNRPILGFRFLEKKFLCNKDTTFKKVVPVYAEPEKAIAAVIHQPIIMDKAETARSLSQCLGIGLLCAFDEEVYVFVKSTYNTLAVNNSDNYPSAFIDAFEDVSFADDSEVKKLLDAYSRPTPNFINSKKTNSAPFPTQKAFQAFYLGDSPLEKQFKSENQLKAKVEVDSPRQDYMGMFSRLAGDEDDVLPEDEKEKPAKQTFVINKITKKPTAAQPLGLDIQDVQESEEDKEEARLAAVKEKMKNEKHKIIREYQPKLRFEGGVMQKTGVREPFLKLQQELGEKLDKITAKYKGKELEHWEKVHQEIIDVLEDSGDEDSKDTIVACVHQIVYDDPVVQAWHDKGGFVADIGTLFSGNKKGDGPTSLSGKIGSDSEPASGKTSNPFSNIKLQNLFSPLTEMPNKKSKDIKTEVKQAVAAALHSGRLKHNKGRIVSQGLLDELLAPTQSPMIGGNKYKPREKSKFTNMPVPNDSHRHEQKIVERTAIPAAIGGVIKSNPRVSRDRTFSYSGEIGPVVLTSTSAPAGDMFLVRSEFVTPTNYNIFGTEVVEASIYEQFQIMDFKVKYTPTGVLSDGSVLAYFDTDPSDTGLVTEQQIMDNKYALKAYRGTPFVLDYKRKGTFYTNPTGSSVSETAEKRQDFAGQLRVFVRGLPKPAAGDAVELGTLFVEARFKLMSRKQPEGLLAKSHQPFNADQYLPGYKTHLKVMTFDSVAYDVYPIPMHVHQSYGFSRSAQALTDQTPVDPEVADKAELPGSDNWMSLNVASIPKVGSNAKLHIMAPSTGGGGTTGWAFGVWFQNESGVYGLAEQVGSLTLPVYNDGGLVTPAQFNMDQVVAAGTNVMGYAYWRPSDAGPAYLLIQKFTNNVYDSTTDRFADPSGDVIRSVKGKTTSKQFILPDNLAGAVSYLEELKGAVYINQNEELCVVTKESEMRREMMEMFQKVVDSKTGQQCKLVGSDCKVKQDYTVEDKLSVLIDKEQKVRYADISSSDSDEEVIVVKKKDGKKSIGSLGSGSSKGDGPVGLEEVSPFVNRVRNMFEEGDAEMNTLENSQLFLEIIETFIKLTALTCEDSHYNVYDAILDELEARARGQFDHGECRGVSSGCSFHRADMQEPLEQLVLDLSQHFRWWFQDGYEGFDVCVDCGCRCCHDHNNLFEGELYCDECRPLEQQEEEEESDFNGQVAQVA